MLTVLLRRIFICFIIPLKCILMAALRQLQNTIFFDAEVGLTLTVTITW